MIIYSQRDPRWANHIYSAIPPNTETIKSSGCGVTSAAIIISNLTTEIITPDVMADYSIQNGFKIDGVGTTFALFPAIANKWTLNCIQTSDINKAVDCVENGGMVVCSTTGGTTGLFSTSGHLFVMSGVNGDSLEFIDPDLYQGKYNVSYRKNKATVKNGKVYVRKNTAKPYISAYFLFSKIATFAPSITDVTNELLWRGIITNQPLWNGKAQSNDDLKWLFVKYYPYIISNGGSVKSRNITSDIALTILHDKGIISNVSLWNNLAYEDREIFQLLVNMADYISLNIK